MNNISSSYRKFFTNLSLLFVISFLFFGHRIPVVFANTVGGNFSTTTSVNADMSVDQLRGDFSNTTSSSVAYVRIKVGGSGVTTSDSVGIEFQDLTTGTNLCYSRVVAPDTWISLAGGSSITQYDFDTTNFGGGCFFTANHTYLVVFTFILTSNIGHSNIPLSSGISSSASTTSILSNHDVYVELADSGGFTPTTATHNPILIIPGVLGTDILKDSNKLWLDLGRNFTDIGDHFMDPLQFNTDLTPLDISLTIGNLLKNPFIGQHYYDLIVQEFQNQGYVEGTDLFLFPYDWRYGVSEDIVNQLRQKITTILNQTGATKVDIVAHSTGGLLVKKYVIENLSNSRIDKAVFVGVPNTGAPKAIKTLLQGDGFGIPWLADSEMQKIAKNLPIVYDLSPSQQYFNTKGSYIKIVDQNFFLSSDQDLDFNQANSFLTNDHGLNSQAIVNSHNLHTASFDNYDLRTAGIDLYAIDGCKSGTLGKVIERRSKDIFGNTLTDYDQPEETPGDGTVPLESATNLPINQDHKYYALKSEHGKMPSQDGIRQEIVNLLSGSTLNINSSLVTQDISQCKLNGKAISISFPLNIDITDQDGHHTGLVSGGIQNDIPNADFEIMGGHKFIYLPNDQGQSYNIKVKGIDTGTFTLKDQNINNNQVTQTEVFSNIPVTTSLGGRVNLGNMTTLSLDNNGDGIIDQTVQPSSNINSNQSQDLIPPVSTSTLTGKIGQPDFYSGNVNIALSATDPIIMDKENQTSGVLKIVYKLDNNPLYTTYLNPITVSLEGKHTLKFFSTDNAGNNEIEQSITFTIDITPPELQVTFDTNTKDVIFSAQDVMDQHPIITTTNASITLKDNAGNTTIIPFTKLKEIPTRIRLTYNKITRNGIVVTVPNTNIVYDWQEKKDTLIDLDTKVTVKGVEKYVFNYKKADNGTTIKEKTSTGTTTTIKNGFIIVTVKTDGDGVKVNY